MSLSVKFVRRSTPQLFRLPRAFTLVELLVVIAIIGILIAWVVRAEQPTPTELIGGAIMLAGAAAAVINRRRRVPGETPMAAAPEPNRTPRP